MSEDNQNSDEMDMKSIESFLEDADEFLLRAEEALGANMIKDGFSRSPEKDKIRKTASKMVSKMVNKIRRGRGVDMHADCEHLLRRHKDAEQKVTRVMEQALSAEEILLEQGVQVYQRLQSCRMHNESLRSAKKGPFESLMNWMADISSAESDLHAIINYLSQVRKLEEDGDIRSMSFMKCDIYDRFEEKGESREVQANEDKNRGLSEAALLDRLEKTTAARESVGDYFTREIESMTRLEGILGSLKDAENAMKTVLSEVVPEGQVDAFVESKVTESGRRSYDHSLCNDCDTAARMCEEFVDLVRENHAKATEATARLQRCLMVNTQLRMVKQPLYEKSITGSEDAGKPPLLRSLSSEEIASDSEARS